MFTEEILNALSRYYSRRKVNNNWKKISEIGLEKIAKTQKISKDELNKAEKLQKNQQMN